jgi:malate dehydrogenase
VTVSLYTISYLRFPIQTRSVQIVPLFSQSSHPLPADFAASDLEALATRVQFGGDEVVKAKDGNGSATLSMAYAGAEFAAKILRAIKGEAGITVPTYINLTSDPSGGEALKKELGTELEYFSPVVTLGVSPLSSSYDLM